MDCHRKTSDDSVSDSNDETAPNVDSFNDSHSLERKQSMLLKRSTLVTALTAATSKSYADIEGCGDIASNGSNGNYTNRAYSSHDDALIDEKHLLQRMQQKLEHKPSSAPQILQICHLDHIDISDTESLTSTATRTLHSGREIGPASEVSSICEIPSGLWRRASLNVLPMAMNALDHVSIDDGETTGATYDIGNADAPNYVATRIVNLHQTFTFPKRYTGNGKDAVVVHQLGTQTSKTLLELVNGEIITDLRLSTSSTVLAKRNSLCSNTCGSVSMQFLPVSGPSAVASTPSSGRRSKSHNKHIPVKYPIKRTVSEGGIGTNPVKYEPRLGFPEFHEAAGNRNLDMTRSKSKGPNRKKVRPLQPCEPKLCQSSPLTLERELIRDDSSRSTPSNHDQITLNSVIDKLYNFSWETVLIGLNELLCIAPHLSWSMHDRAIVLINRKLLDCFKSPRVSVGRVACQVCGELFRIVKCTKRPEFDELVDALLCKSADTNRHVQRDANIALDKMVSYTTMFHSVRAMCNHGTEHRNAIVRVTVARLLIYVCALNGNEALLGMNANQNTRRRVLQALAILLMDKNQDVRRFAERLLKMLQKHRYFQEYFYKDMELSMRNTLKLLISKLNMK